MPAGVAWYFAPAVRSDCFRAAALHVSPQYRWPWSQRVHRKNICRHIARPQVRRRRLSSTAHAARLLLATRHVPVYVSLTASEPRTQARRARWAPQWLLGGPSSSWASLSALRRSSPQLPHKFSVSPGPPRTPRPGHLARLERTAGPSHDHDDDGDRRRNQLDVDPPSRGSR